MERLGAARARIAAAVGPCIGQAAYEVGPEFETAFLAHDPANTRFFVRADAQQRARFDLSGYVGHRLLQAGVARPGRVGACTYRQSDSFFSYRRSQTRGESDYGRQISAIVLT
jgi:copper oxidase (laccase) domain-containing protein